LYDVTGFRPSCARAQPAGQIAGIQKTLRTKITIEWREPRPAAVLFEICTSSLRRVAPSPTRKDACYPVRSRPPERCARARNRLGPRPTRQARSTARGYARGLPQTNRLNQGAHQVPRVHLGVVCEHQVLRVVALALGEVELVVGDRCGASAVTRGKNGSQVLSSCRTSWERFPSFSARTRTRAPASTVCGAGYPLVCCSTRTRALESSSSRVSRPGDSGRVALLRLRRRRTRHRLLTGLAPINDRLIRQPGFGAVLGNQCRLSHHSQNAATMRAWSWRRRLRSNVL
jgi:hypothetical protein